MNEEHQKSVEALIKYFDERTDRWGDDLLGYVHHNIQEGQRVPDAMKRSAELFNKLPYQERWALLRKVLKEPGDPSDETRYDGEGLSELRDRVRALEERAGVDQAMNYEIVVVHTVLNLDDEARRILDTRSFHLTEAEAEKARPSGIDYEHTKLGTRHAIKIGKEYFLLAKKKPLKIGG